MKKLFFAAGMMAILPSFAVVYRTNDVDGLIYLLKTYNGKDSSTVIELEPGDYWLPNTAMYTNINASWGSGPSTLYAENLRIRGTGATNAATRLIGAGNYRVACGAWNATFENLTITNGHSSAFPDAGNANRGGGVYGGCTLTNCLLIGNRSDGVGGAAHSTTKLYDCQVINNIGSSGGGAHNITAWRTLFRGNVAATGDGGAVYTVILYDCIVEGNTAPNGGGGGGYNVTYATNTLFIGNRSKGAGGGTGNHTSNADPAGNVLVDCVISNNVSSNIGGGVCALTATNCLIACNVGSSGGGAYNCNLIGCTVRGNRGNSGGGIYFYPFASGKNFKPLVASGCVIEHTICSNSAAHAYGGGVYYSSDGSAVHTVSNCIIRGNAALSTPSTVGTGGGVGGMLSNLGDSQMIVDCDIHDNWADSYGGGVRSASLLRCRIYRNGGNNNGPGAYSCQLTDCDMAHATADYGWGLRTVYHDVGTPFTIEGNPYKSGTFTYYGVILYYPNCTNCLFRDNRATGYMLRGTASPNQSASLVNCTVVSNSANYLFGYFAQAAYPLTLENCLFHDNFSTNGTTSDLSIDIADSSNACNSNSVHLSHCAFRTDTVSSKQRFADWFDEGQFIFGQNGFPDSPRFAHGRDAAHPYCLRTSSPLLGIGKVQDWMADATDIRGEGFPRLKDGKADIGCYQCWYNPPGTSFIFR